MFNMQLEAISIKTVYLRRREPENKISNQQPRQQVVI